VKPAPPRESLGDWFRGHKLKELGRWLTPSEPDPAEQAERIWHVERNVGLSIKVVVIGVVFYYLFFSGWVEGVEGAPWSGGPPDAHPALQVVLETIRRFFLLYIVFNIGGGFILWSMEQFPLTLVRWVVLAMAAQDLLLLAALTAVTGGFDSFLYWGFLALMARNTASLPVAGFQIVLNLLACALYLFAGLLDLSFLKNSADQSESTPEPLLLRVSLLILMAACCYGLQVLIDRERVARREAREFALRQDQLQATARLAAEIAHQLKNPLGIINNAAYTLQRNVKEGKSTITQQIRIIREEIDRSDRIITELMGYAKLVEGQVERLDVAQELDRALDQVFPPAVQFDVEIHRDYAPALPALMMQRSHLNEVFVNLLQNAREAMRIEVRPPPPTGVAGPAGAPPASGQRSQLWVSAQYGEDYSVVVTIADNGPGIRPEDLARVFEPYFTTKEKGTGLGLAIVKHNVEIYGGKVRVESELGKGTRFVLQLPARTSMKLIK
jgi:signal transduction histidine kinase